MGISTSTIHQITRHGDNDQTVICIGDIELPVKSIKRSAEKIMLVAGYNPNKFDEIIKSFADNCNIDVEKVREIFTTSDCHKCVNLAFEVACILQGYKDKIDAQQLELEELRQNKNK
jgi:energy-converting hydrogenase A subunit M